MQHLDCMVILYEHQIEKKNLIITHAAALELIIQETFLCIKVNAYNLLTFSSIYVHQA